MFAHFSPSIVPEEAELLRILMCQVAAMQAQPQIPTFHTHVLSPDSGEKAPASDSSPSAVSQCFLRACGKNRDAAVRNRDGSGGSVPVLPRLGC